MEAWTAATTKTASLRRAAEAAAAVLGIARRALCPRDANGDPRRLLERLGHAPIRLGRALEVARGPYPARDSQARLVVDRLLPLRGELADHVGVIPQIAARRDEADLDALAVRQDLVEPLRRSARVDVQSRRALSSTLASDVGLSTEKQTRMTCVSA